MPQSQASKLGEIRYRQKISAQHTDKQIFFKNEPDQKEIKKILAERLKKYKKDFAILRRQILLKSPFLEIGAEYAIASLLLKNHYSLEGFASDISLHSLTKTRHFAKIFNLHKIPGLLCADAENIPLKSNSIPFIFTYETIHHFPNPTILFKEIYRVLSPGGIFFIGSDPIIPSFQIKIWKRPSKLRWWEKLLKILLILPFISHIGDSEEKYGINEGGFNLKTWLNSLQIFNEIKVKITLYPFGPSTILKKHQQPNIFYKSYLFLFGGDIQAVCYKKGLMQNSSKVFICPNCRKNKKGEFELSSNLTCTNCTQTYNKFNKIPILLEYKLASNLHLKKSLK